MIWFTADHHFGHKNIIGYCRRPFFSVDNMDEEMIFRWNEVVSPKDAVYYLGDFTLKGIQDAESYIERLNGNIKFISGSHDYGWYPVYAKRYPAECLGNLVDIKIGNTNFTLCHYSMRTWNKSHYGSIHLFGHSHGEIPPYGYSMDVGVDTNNFYPYSFDDIMSTMNKKELVEYRVYGTQSKMP